MWIVCVVLSVASILAEPPAPARAPRPVVIWHGLSDSGLNQLSTGKIEAALKEALPGVFVLPIVIGDDAHEDKVNSWVIKIDKQVGIVCDKIQHQPELQQGYNAIGMSQGSQFLRAVAQMCPNPRMFNLISLGGQHQGIYGFDDGKFRYFTRPFLKGMKAAHWRLVRRCIVPMQYWHDPTCPDQYREENNFIAKINNEKVFIPSYRDNLLKLENFVLVKYRFDQKVIPLSSQWFEFYKPGSTEEILPLEASPLWIEDRIGLRELSETGRLHFIEHEEGAHLRHSKTWLKIYIIDKFLK